MVGGRLSVLTDKIQLEDLMAEWVLQEGDAFTQKRFFDEFFAVGVIPTVLTRWEMTGIRDPLLDIN